MKDNNNKEKYPIEILPHPSFWIRLDVNKLLAKYKNLLVVRLIIGGVQEYIIETESGKKCLSERVFVNNMANLSLNLAGGLFDTNSNAHLRFLPACADATLPWNGESVPAVLYRTPDNYKIYDTCFGLCFKVKDIHNRTFPYYKHFESQEERNEYERNAAKATSDEEKAYDAHFVGIFEGKKHNVEVRPRIKIHHSPTMLNYWHMTLDTYRPTDADYIHPKEKLKSSDKAMLKSLKQDLIQCCKIDADPGYRIESCDYIEKRCKES